METVTRVLSSHLRLRQHHKYHNLSLRPVPQSNCRRASRQAILYLHRGNPNQDHPRPKDHQTERPGVSWEVLSAQPEVDRDRQDKRH